MGPNSIDTYVIHVTVQLNGHMMYKHENTDSLVVMAVYQRAISLDSSLALIVYPFSQRTRVTRERAGHYASPEGAYQ